ncbi:BTAD domain-containing putative transcriptional regulator [Streptosporangium fragile]|uniref:BTAD domain-containing putative transcriptional regulator n=1 Tax=Streptosporangium fragile TaxID=46186 RepID=A0ABN3VUR0_9ACTN
MEFRVLGPVEIYDDGTPVDLGGRRPRAVLARLLIARGAVVSTDTLIEDLYDGAPPPSALSTLQSYVSNLRRIIEPGRNPRTPPRLLIGRPPGYLLATGDVDALRFTELVNRSEFGPPGQALTCLDEALQLWRGMPYGEFGDETWAVTEVNRLRELRLVAIERRAQALLSLGRPQVVIHELEAETAANPLRERLWCLLALALYRTGRQADALAVLRGVGTMLTDQFGLDPGPELRALENDILQQVESLDPVNVTARLAPPEPSPPRRVLHGRERQLAELKRLPVRAAASGVAIAAVSGEPGIGKTSLLEAFRDHCADLGHLVLWGRCHDTEGAPPLWPWLQVLGVLAQHCPPPDRTALAGLLDDRAPSGPAEGALLRRNQAIAQWLAAASRNQPLVIVLDDLHWADPASLDLLRDVIVLTGGPVDSAALTLVTAFRDMGFHRGAAHGTVLRNGTTGLSVDELLGRLVGYDLLRLRLTGLEAHEVRAVATEMGADVDEPTAHKLTARTGGNPFFVRESVRLLAQGHALNTVPDAVAELVRLRLGTLGPEVGEALRTAAVIGRDFDPAIVAEICRGEAYDLLDQAAQAGLLIPRDGRMTFAHDLVRETLVRDIPPLRKAMIHREVMAALSARPGSDVAVIAHHAVEAGPAAYGEAARWAQEAAEQASLRLAYEEAARWWGAAINAHDVSGGDAVDHVELLLRQVRALLEAGDPIGARQARAKAVQVADRARTRPEPAVRALTALDAPALWTLRDPYKAVEPRLVHRFEAALRELPEGDNPERVRLLGGLAQELYDGTGDPRGHALSAEAVAMARRLDDPHLLMWALNARHLALPQPQRIPELVDIADELYDLALSTRAAGFELLARMLHTHNKLELFDLAGADEAAARCDALLERMPLPWPRFQHTLWRANRLALDGRFDDAEALYDQAEAQAERLGVWHARQSVVMGRIGLHCQRGTMAEIGPLADVIAGVHPTMGHDARVLYLCAHERVRQARDLAGERRPVPPSDWSWLSATCLRGAAQAALGRRDECRTTYATLLPYGRRISALSAVICVGPVDWYLALLAAAAGDHHAARRHLTTLERLADRNGLTWWRDRARAAARTSPAHPADSATRRTGGEPSGADRTFPLAVPGDGSGCPSRVGSDLAQPALPHENLATICSWTTAGAAGR